MIFKLSELRKKHNMTQQELGEVLGVSYQTISKWETGVTMPDISVLPQISAYFGISVDALLGLVPLEDIYKPSNSGRRDYWENRLEYLRRTRQNLWNEDYVKFLIQEVWKIDRPITLLDCGCGQGALGLLMMPLLPEGSKYVGVDFTKSMLEDARENFKRSHINGSFILSDIREFKTDEPYDMVISQAVLRHVDHGEAVLRKMIEFLKDGGILVSIECNREFEADGLYVEGMDYLRLCEREGLKKLWKTELEKQNRDYSIAMKIPSYMTKAGLRNVECRMSDRVTYLEPTKENYDKILDNIIKADDWDDEQSERDIEDKIAYFMNHGMSRVEAEEYCNQQMSIVKYLKMHHDHISLTKMPGIMISYCWKGSTNNYKNSLE